MTSTADTSAPDLGKLDEDDCVSEPAPKSFQRARSQEAKQVRREAILAAAQRLFDEKSYEGLTVDAVAKTSRIAKGTVYLYFGTKEAIFLELLLLEVEAWFAALAEPLDQLDRGDIPGVANLLSRSLGERRTLRRLASLLHQTLEQNVDAKTVHSFKRRALESMAPTAARLERCLPQLAPGEGLKLLLDVHAFVIGVGHMAEPGQVVAQVIAEPGFELYRVDFVPKMRELVEMVLRGWVRRS
jgi:AcrR family transcriptional regulator